MKIKVKQGKEEFAVTDDKGRKVDGVVGVTVEQRAGEDMMATVVIRVPYEEPKANG